MWSTRPGVQRRLLVEADLSLKKAFQLIQGMEAAAKNTEEMQREKSMQHAAAATNVVHTTEAKTKKPSCSRCLGTGHSQATCKYKTSKCSRCHKVGHLAKACYKPPPSQHQGATAKAQSSKGHVRQVTNNPSEQPADIVTIRAVTEGLPGSYKVIMEVNNQPIEMELNTGAIVSLVSEVTWTQ